MRRRAFLATAASALAAPALAQPGRVATLRFVPQSNLVSLDPIWTTATVTANHGYYVYDTLYGVDGRMRPQPQMAEGHETSDDGRTWRIRLRDGLLFHDGTPVRAIDCAASLKRFAAADEFGKLLGRVVERWGAADDRTLEIKLTKPFPLLLDVLAKTDSRVPFIMPERLAQTRRPRPRSPRWSAPARTGSCRTSTTPAAASRMRSSPATCRGRRRPTGPRAARSRTTTGSSGTSFPTPRPPRRRCATTRWMVGEPDRRPIPMLRRDANIRMMIQNPAGQLRRHAAEQPAAPFDKEAIRRAVMMAVDQEDYMGAVYGTEDKSVWRTCYSLFPCGTPLESEEGGALLRGSHDPAKVKARSGRGRLRRGEGRSSSTPPTSPPSARSAR